MGKVAKSDRKGSTIEERIAQSKGEKYIRLVRRNDIPGPHKAYQMQQITVVADKVVNTKMLRKPNTLEQILNESHDALDPEAIV